MKTSSYAVGQLILRALEFPIKKILIFPYDGISNDLGCGIACALGVKFYNKNHEEFIPTGATLNQIDDFILSSLNVKLKYLEFILVKDDRLSHNKENECEEGLINLSKIINKKYDTKIESINQELNFSLLQTFYQCKTETLANIFLKMVNFEKELFRANYVIYTDDEINSRTIQNELFKTIYEKCKNRRVPLICFAKKIDQLVEPNLIGYEIIQNNSLVELKVTIKEDIYRLMTSFITKL
jgi:glycerate kinase